MSGVRRGNPLRGIRAGFRWDTPGAPGQLPKQLIRVTSGTHESQSVKQQCTPGVVVHGPRGVRLTNTNLMAQRTDASLAEGHSLAREHAVAVRPLALAQAAGVGQRLRRVCRAKCHVEKKKSTWLCSRQKKR